jgi:hypothetical protein
MRRAAFVVAVEDVVVLYPDRWDTSYERERFDQLARLGVPVSWPLTAEGIYRRYS